MAAPEQSFKADVERIVADELSGIQAQIAAAGDPEAISELQEASDQAVTRLNSLEARPSGIQFPQARGTVVLTLDDGWDTHPTVADMMAARGQAGTFYLTADLLDTSQHMATSAVAGIAGYSVGHEIGCHSKTHVNMTGLNATTRAEQWASAATLEALLPAGRKVRSYAYPLGNNDLTTNQEAYGRFDRVASIGLSQGYYTGASGYAPWLYDMDTETFRHGRFPWSPSTHGQLMALLRDHVRRRPVILPVYTHQIDSGDSPTMAQLTEMLNYCQANGIPMLTSSQAFPGPKVVNPGFEDGLDGWTVLTAGNGSSAVVDTATDTPGAGLPGTKALRVVSSNTTTSGDSVHIFQTLPAKPLTAYSVSARFRHDGTPSGTGRFSVRINEFNGMGGSISGRSVRGSAATSGSWAQSVATPAADAASYIVAGKTHPDCRFVTVGFYLQEATGTFYGDHLYFGPTEEGLLG